MVTILDRLDIISNLDIAIVDSNVKSVIRALEGNLYFSDVTEKNKNYIEAVLGISVGENKHIVTVFEDNDRVFYLNSGGEWKEVLLHHGTKMEKTCQLTKLN